MGGWFHFGKGSNEPSTLTSRAGQSHGHPYGPGRVFDRSQCPFITCASLPKTPRNLGGAGFSYSDKRISVKTIHVSELLKVEMLQVLRGQ